MLEKRQHGEELD